MSQRIEIEVRDKKQGGDYEAVTTEGLTEMVEIVGFSDQSPAQALQRLLRALENFGIQDDLHVVFSDGWETYFVYDSGSFDETDADDERLRLDTNR